MKAKKPRQPMPLFESQSPDWDALSKESQQRLIDGLAKILRERMDQSHKLTTTDTIDTQEEIHVS